MRTPATSAVRQRHPRLPRLHLAQAEHFLAAILTRLDDVELAGEPVGTRMFIRGLSSLPVVLRGRYRIGLARPEGRCAAATTSSAAERIVLTRALPPCASIRSASVGASLVVYRYFDSRKIYSPRSSCRRRCGLGRVIIRLGSDATPEQLLVDGLAMALIADQCTGHSGTVDERGHDPARRPRLNEGIPR